MSKIDWDAASEAEEQAVREIEASLEGPVAKTCPFCAIGFLSQMIPLAADEKMVADARLYYCAGCHANFQIVVLKNPEKS